MSARLQHPHDKFFRDSFGRPQIATEFVRHYVPSAIANQLRLETLEVVDGVFIDSDLQQQQSDILYKLQTVNDDDLYVYLLLEHKSKPERTIFLQLIQYIARIWKQEWRANAERPLVSVLPIVVYQGEAAWRISAELRDLVHAIPHISPHIPNFRYELVDLSPFSDAEIRGDIWLRLCLGILRAAFDPAAVDYLPALIGLMNELTQKETGLEYVETVLTYLYVGSRSMDRVQLETTFVEHFADGGELAMTVGQELFQEGERKGEVNALTGVIVALLTQRFGEVPKSVVQQIKALKNAERLHQLSLSAALSESLDQFLASLTQPQK